jgi:hypothetical protein
VRHGIKIPAVTLGLLTAALALALFAAGCGTSRGNTAQNDTVQSCADYGVQAIEHHVIVTRTPPPCHGLTAAQINQAVGIAIVRVAGGAPKAVWRKRAAQAGRYLDRLATTLPASPSSRPGEATGPVAAAGALGGRDAGMDTAALIAWLVTAGSGFYVLRNWLSHGGTLRPAPGPTGTGTSTGSPPLVIIGHFGLAAAGLVLWIAYLVAGWNALAWIAVAVLLPVAGLGMAALAIGLPASSVVGAPDAARATPAVVSIGAGGVGVLPARAVKRRLSPLLVVAHGALAVTTMTLVLLAAIGTPRG